MTIVMPDLVSEIIDVLSTAHDGTTVATDLTGFQSGDDWIVLTENPGQEIVRNRLHAPVFNFEVYSGTIESTRSLAMAAYSTVTGMVNHMNDDLVITFIDVIQTPFSLTDLVNIQPRYIFTAGIYYRPR